MKARVAFPEKLVSLLAYLFIDMYISCLLHTASLEQPGQELAELEAKLLRIEQLQIELEVRIPYDPIVANVNTRPECVCNYF